MKESKEKQLWVFPWLYRESICIVLGVVVVGYLLQILFGNFNFKYFSYPINFYAGIITILLPLVLSIFIKTKFYKWLSGVHLSIVLIFFLLILALISGLIPQIKDNPGNKNLSYILGLNRLTSSRPFVLVYFFLLISLGALIIRKLRNFRLKDYCFHLNHIGLWVVFFFAGLGYADMERHVVKVNIGDTEWRSMDDNGKITELPIAIRLEDFKMEEYPPKIAIINKNTGDILPVKEPHYFDLNQNNKIDYIDNWKIELKEDILPESLSYPN